MSTPKQLFNQVKSILTGDTILGGYVDAFYERYRDDLDRSKQVVIMIEPTDVLETSTDYPLRSVLVVAISSYMIEPDPDKSINDGSEKKIMDLEQDIKNALRPYYDLGGLCINFKNACDRKLPLSGVFFSEDYYSWLPYHKLCEVHDKSGEYYKAIMTAEKLLGFENLPERHRDEIVSFMQLWGEKLIDQQPVTSGIKGRRNFLIVDKTGQFTREIKEHYEKRFNVEEIRMFVPQYMKWADYVWFDWCDKNLALASGMKWGPRVMATLRSYEYFTPYPDEVKWENIDGLIFIADHVMELAVEKFPSMKKTEIHLVHDGVNTERFSFRQSEPGRNVAWVGLLNRKKNVPLLLEIANKFRDLRFHIAGEFQDERVRLFFDNYVQKNRLQNISFHGLEH